MGRDIIRRGSQFDTLGFFAYGTEGYLLLAQAGHETQRTTLRIPRNIVRGREELHYHKVRVHGADRGQDADVLHNKSFTASFAVPAVPSDDFQRRGDNQINMTTADNLQQWIFIL